MDFTKRVQAFISLGKFLSQYSTSGITKNDHPLNGDFFDGFQSIINRSHESNGWFTKDSVLFAVESWAKSLNEESLSNWLKTYDLEHYQNSKTIGLIAAGNIPLVGFHDALCVLITGHKLQLKLSKKDHQLMFFIVQLLQVIEPEFKASIEITEGNLKGYDAVIATGSENTARYFEYYFGKHPHIIRKNRNSVALLTGDESPEEMEALAEDVFRYFGLGCRNVSKLLVPKGYDLSTVFKGLYPYKDIIELKKYENNYDYNKAVFMMSKAPLLDNGFIIFKEDESYSSPIGCLFYEYYDNLDEAKKKLALDIDYIQCIVAKKGVLGNTVNFGETQNPGLADYADGVDTIAFLTSL